MGSSLILKLSLWDGEVLLPVIVMWKTEAEKGLLKVMGNVYGKASN